MEARRVIRSFRIHGNYIFEAGACCSGFLTGLHTTAINCGGGGRKIQNMIYLSGGLHSGWQQKFNHLPVIDPRKHGLTNPVDIQEWMVEKIKQASIVVCYLEKQNPGGYSMAFEIGVAVSLGKSIYIVDEKQEKYFTIAKSSALEFNSLDELINAIKL